MQSAEKHISDGLFSGQALFCFLQGSSRMTNAWAIAKVAGDRPKPSRMLLDVDARFIGNLGQALRCTRIGRFLQDFCSAASRRGARL
jgi:hypothetical protein